MLEDMSFFAMNEHELVRVETTKGIVDPPKALPFFSTLALCSLKGDIVLDESLCFALAPGGAFHSYTTLLFGSCTCYADTW